MNSEKNYETQKLPRHLENPFDNIFIQLSSFVSPIFVKFGFSANHLTILSGIFMLSSLIYMVMGSFITATILYTIGYWFDIFDGYYARKYGYVSSFGDKLDHYKDLLVLFGLGIVVFFHPTISLRDKVIFFSVSLVFGIIIGIFTGCQEIFYSQDYSLEGSDFLKPFKKLCVGNAESLLEKTRWFGLGSFTIFLALFLLVQSYIHRHPSKKKK